MIGVVKDDCLHALPKSGSCGGGRFGGGEGGVVKEGWLGRGGEGGVVREGW